MKKGTKLNSLKDHRLGRLRILFKEVLQQIPPDKADELCEQWLAGRDIVFVLRQSSGGRHCKTAFTFASGDLVQLEGNQCRPN